jgi:hypothetical protein
MTQMVAELGKQTSTSLVSEIERASTQHARMFALSIVAIFLAAIATAVVTYLVWRSGNRVQSAIRSEADVRIADAQATAAQANKEVAEARKETAQALKEAAILTERAGKLEVEGARQREKAATAEKELLELQLRVRPRTLGTQRGPLLSALIAASPKGPVEIRCVTGDGEGCAYANEIRDVLALAGWAPGAVLQAIVMVTGPTGKQGSAIGISMTLRSVNAAPARAETLQNAFESVGLPLNAMSQAGYPEDGVGIVVGSKPL